MDCILETIVSGKHNCVECGKEFDCKSYNKATGLCKCDQQISICDCDICKPQTVGLSFYCSEECEQNAVDQYDSDDDDLST